MKTTRLVAMLAGLLAVAAFAADASAMYNPSTGTWLQRDPGPGGMMAASRVGAAGPAAGGGFVPRDPTEQYDDGMNLYQYARSEPEGNLDPYGLWTKKGVLVFLCRTEQGRNIVSNIDGRGIKVWRSQHVISEFHTRANAGAAWSDWEPYHWGAMNDANGSHIPQADSDESAALLIVHETTHGMGGDEMAAYTAETQVGIATPGLSPRWPQFVKETREGRTVDTAAIRTMLDAPASPYDGWYAPSPRKEWKRDGGGQVIVSYGTEEQQKDWKCTCPQEFYYYDTANPGSRFVRDAGTSEIHASASP